MYYVKNLSNYGNMKNYQFREKTVIDLKGCFVHNYIHNKQSPHVKFISYADYLKLFIPLYVNETYIDILII